jgi:hypothetical protein
MGTLRVAVKDGMLSKETHRKLIYIIGYIAWKHRIAPSGADLEGAVYEDVEKEVYEDVVCMLNRRYGKFKYRDFLEVAYE